MNLDQIQTSLTKALADHDYHQAAQLVVEARRDHFLTVDGSPDLQGRSYAYRQWYGEAVDAVGLKEDERTKLLGRMRFHIGNALRDSLTADELTSAGLLQVSPVKRGKANYEQRSMPHRIVTGTHRLSSDEEIDQLCEFLHGITTRLDPSNMAEASRYELVATTKALLKKISA